MAAPTIPGAQTPWAGYTFGRLVELALREIGLSNPAHASPDVNLPEASAAELLVVKDLTREALCFFQDARSRYFSLSEASVVAAESGVTAGTWPSVLLPADLGVIARNGLKVAGRDVCVLSTEQYLERRRPDSEGGGIYLTPVTGPYVTYARIAPAAPASDSAAWQLALWAYPVQKATWTLEVVYRATAKNLSGDTDTVRVPLKLLPMILRYVSAAWRERTGDIPGAAMRWKLFREQLNEIENIPPSEELGLELTQGYPL